MSEDARAEIRALLNDPAKLHAVATDAFQAIDTDGSGFISGSELSNAMIAISKDAGIAPPSQADIDSAMKALDSNSDNQLSLNEFEVLIRSILESLLADL